MNSFEKTAIIIPCHNEESSIQTVLASLNKILPDACCVVINDGSTDRTAEIVRECAQTLPHVVLIDLPVNLGIGGAVQTGFRYAERNGFEYAVKTDGDGQHPADQIPLLLEPLFKDKVDMVIGSRFLEKDGFQSTQVRRGGILVFRLLNSFLIHQRVTDNTSGFRAYNRSAIRFAAEHYPAFDYPEPEEVILMAKNKFRLCEIPVLMKERQGGISSINLSRSFYYMVKVTFAVLMAKIRRPERETE